MSTIAPVLVVASSATRQSGRGAPSGYEIKLFYVDPDQSLIGNWVAPGRTIGTAQDLTLRYPAIPGRGVMTNHVHVEIRSPRGGLVNPRTLIP